MIAGRVEFCVLPSIACLWVPVCWGLWKVFAHPSAGRGPLWGLTAVADLKPSTFSLGYRQKGAPKCALLQGRVRLFNWFHPPAAPWMFRNRISECLFSSISFFFIISLNLKLILDIKTVSALPELIATVQQISFQLIIYLCSLRS